MAKTPLQVEEAAKLAEELHERMFSKQEEISDEDTQEDEDTPSDDIDDDDVEDDDEDIEDDVPHDDDIAELRKFKARYLSLKGKYDAEVPTLHKELNEFKKSVVDRLSTLTSDEPKPPKEDIKDDVVSRLKEEYGDDFIDSVTLLAEQIAERKIKASITPVQEKVDSVEDTQIKVAKEEFKKYLDDNVKGDWQKLWEGKDKGFYEFLEKPDPSGLYTYGELINLYNEKWEAGKLATVLNTYLESKPRKEKTPQPNSAEKDSLIAPSRSATHHTPDIDDKTIWTKDSIKEFQRLDRQGKFSPEESMAKWNDLLAAASENRIR